jgi:hypothetical protein
MVASYSRPIFTWFFSRFLRVRNPVKLRFCLDLGWTVFRFRLPSTPCSNFTFSVLPLQIASESATSCDVDYGRSPSTRRRAG